jgi:hypothetical protein
MSLFRCASQNVRSILESYFSVLPVRDAEALKLCERKLLFKCSVAVSKTNSMSKSTMESRVDGDI